MNLPMVGFAVSILTLLWAAGVRADEAGPDANRNAQVRSIFTARCAECHGPQLQRPKGGVSLYDLQELSTNPDLVVPGVPERSALWEVIRNEEMPPRSAQGGP